MAMHSGTRQPIIRVNMAAYKVTGNEKYKAYSEAWANTMSGKVPNQTITESGNMLMVRRMNYVLFAISNLL